MARSRAGSQGSSSTAAPKAPGAAGGGDRVMSTAGDYRVPLFWHSGAPLTVASPLQSLPQRHAGSQAAAYPPLRTPVDRRTDCRGLEPKRRRRETGCARPLQTKNYSRRGTVLRRWRRFHRCISSWKRNADTAQVVNRAKVMGLDRGG